MEDWTAVLLAIVFVMLAIGCAAILLIAWYH
jgi:hypothetical protein